MVIIKTIHEYMNLRSPPSTVAFVKIDTDKCADIAQKYNVRAMPTFIFIKENNVVETVGATNINDSSFPHLVHLGPRSQQGRLAKWSQ